MNSFSQNVEFSKENFEDNPEGYNTAFRSVNRGVEYFGQAYYQKALEFLLDANAFNPNNAELNFLIGNCYLNTIYKGKALKFLQKSFELDKEYSYKINFILGEAYQHNYKFNKAKEEYYKFKLYLPDDSLAVWDELIEKKISECNNGIDIMMNPSDGLIIKLNDINSDEADYAPVITGDGKTIYFTSRRKGSSEGEIDFQDNQPYEDIYYSEKKGHKWTEPQKLVSPINTKYHDATVGVSSDGNELYIYRGQVNGGDLFSSKKENDIWSEPKPLPSSINTKGQENSASISRDNKTLYFISNKEGGVGGKDIYVANRDGKDNWINVKSIGETINTKYDEDGVFITASQNVIYFSSNGHKTMGGYDIFYSVRESDSTWSEPINMGYPINSPDDDIFFYVTNDETQGYYSSLRRGGEGGKDNYTIRFSETDDEIYIATETVFDCPNECMQELCVTLDVSYFEDKKGEFLKYEWVLGDGTIKYGSKIKYCYERSGKYHVVLNTITKGGIRTENIKSADIVVEGEQVGRAIISSLDYALIGTEITFDGKNSFYSGGIVTDYLWAFDNGITYNSEVCIQGFDTAGAYQVDLSILALTDQEDSCCYTKANKEINVFNDKKELQEYLISQKNKGGFGDKFIDNAIGLYMFNSVAIDSITGQPIADAKIVLEADNDSIIFTELTDMNGKASYILDHSKDYKVSIVAEGYQEMNYIHSTDYKTENEFSRDTFRILEEEGYLLFAKIHNKETGEPIENLKVRIVDIETGKIICNTRTDERGYFEYQTVNTPDSVKYELLIQKEGNLEKAIFLPLVFSDKKAYNLMEFASLDLEAIYIEDIDLQPIYFEFDSWDIVAEAAIELDKIAKILKDNPAVVIELSSHTDCQGESDYNMLLSKRRAEASINYIVSKEIDASRIVGKWYGETRPNINCDCEPNSLNRCSIASNKLNRRTEFKILRLK